MCLAHDAISFHVENLTATKTTEIKFEMIYKWKVYQWKRKYRPIWLLNELLLICECDSRSNFPWPFVCPLSILIRCEKRTRELSDWKFLFSLCIVWLSRFYFPKKSEQAHFCAAIKTYASKSFKIRAQSKIIHLARIKKKHINDSRIFDRNLPQQYYQFIIYKQVRNS